MAISNITPNECTGCSTCFNICPAKAITMQPDDLGFCYPRINSVKCVECKLCVNICPQNKVFDNNATPIQVIAGMSKDEDTIMSSSSGGAFFEICKLFFQRYPHCVVYGAGFEDGKVKHERVDSLETIDKLKKSKYTQSYLSDTFKKVRNDLLASFTVLFVGTPCQVDGLRNYLYKIDTKKLFTIDLICTGVCSPLLLQNHCKYMEKRRMSHISKYDMRHKQKVNDKWHIMDICIDYGADNQETDDKLRDLFVQTFRHHVALRSSCYNCRYTTLRRSGDITLGDYWKPLPGMKDNENRGISVIISNSEKGNNMIETLKQNMDVYVTTIDDIKTQQPALNFPVKKPHYVVPKNINELSESIKFMERYGRDPLKIRLLIFLSHHMPNFMSVALKKIYYRFIKNKLFKYGKCNKAFIYNLVSIHRQKGGDNR